MAQQTDPTDSRSEAPAFDFGLDRASEIPLGTQLVWRLRTLIAAGRLAGGDRLPGVREMAAAAGVNVNTVRAVYSRLADEGLIVSEHGRGTFVSPRLPSHDELGRLAEQVADRARDVGIDPRELAAALYATPQGAAEAPRPRERGSHPFAAEARRRSTLRSEIARLERELAALELPGDAPEEPRPEPARPRRPTPQLLTAAELEAIRDDLVDRLQRLRADRTLARQERKRERLVPAESPREQRGIASEAPSVVTSGTGWTLRWPG